VALRVIAGELGGRRLVAPPDARPTTDRVREALFSSLGSERLEGAVVLDLFAGSGALAIESLSRGAARAVLVDHDARAVQAIRANLDALGLRDRARAARATVSAFTARAVPEAPFDLVFADPPYALAPEALASVLRSLAEHSLVADGAAVVVERRRASPPSSAPWVLPEGWRIERERAYGDTLLMVAIA